MNRFASTGFDWKDGLLVAAGFAGLVLSLIFLRESLDIEVGKGVQQIMALPAIFAPLIVRRAIWGPPKLGAMRNGIFFRLLSIVGLLMLFFGMAAGAMTMSRMSRASAPKPNFEAAERAIYSPGAIYDFAALDESPEAREQRQKTERDELEARIKKDAAEREQEWLENDAKQKRLDWLFVLATFGLFAIGSFFSSLRYEKFVPESSMPNSNA